MCPGHLVVALAAFAGAALVVFPFLGIVVGRARSSRANGGSW